MLHLRFCTARKGQLWPPVDQRTPHTADSVTVHPHTPSFWYYPGDWKDAWKRENKCKQRHKLVTGFTPEMSQLSEHLQPCLTDVILCNRDNSFCSHSILSCSMASIMAARASTLLMISFSSSVSCSPGGPPDTFIVHPILHPKHTKIDAQSVSGMQSENAALTKGQKKCIAKES